MHYETLALERHGDGVATLTLSRPDKLNALSRTMHAEIQAACAELHEDFETRVLVITGAGRAFTGGADIKEPPEPQAANDLQLRYRAGLGARTCDAVESLDQVTIAAVNGLCVGGGVVLVMSCDIRLAAESAWFSIPEVQLGWPLTWDGLPRLAREIGPSRTLELTTTCDRFTAQQALEWGMIGHVVPDDDLLQQATTLASRIASKPPVAVALTKATMRALKRGMDTGHATYSDADLITYTRVLERWRR